MFKNYKSKKIISYNNVSKFFKKFKKKKTILCHGVFDIVHPGHIRHFAHCKQKADILIVSLTKDTFIKKGTYRPMVPQALRAFNLSSLDVIMPIAPMFHANAWGIHYVATMVGAKLVLPGRHLDGKSIYNLLEKERVTFTAAVPTIWLTLFQYL